MERRINVLAKGHSGISRTTLKRLVAAFNKNCLSRVPSQVALLWRSSSQLLCVWVLSAASLSSLSGVRARTCFVLLIFCLLLPTLFKSAFRQLTANPYGCRWPRLALATGWAWSPPWTKCMQFNVCYFTWAQMATSNSHVIKCMNGPLIFSPPHEPKALPMIRRVKLDVQSCIEFLRSGSSLKSFCVSSLDLHVNDADGTRDR